LNRSTEPIIIPGSDTTTNHSRHDQTSKHSLARGRSVRSKLSSWTTVII